MKILCACEESQAVTSRLRAKGFEAYSCDLLPSSGPVPEYHIQGDVVSLLAAEWDAIIAFPPCTYLTVTGNRWFNVGKYGQKAIKRHYDRAKAIEFFMYFASADCPNIAIENPVGVMSSYYRKPDQIINPFQFGDPYEKKTCFWLKGFPPLVPTKVVEPEPRHYYKSGKSAAPWYANCVKLSPAERSTARSKTFPGIADAMADQWGEWLEMSA